jgi:hypothetical protein
VQNYTVPQNSSRSDNWPDAFTGGPIHYVIPTTGRISEAFFRENSANLQVKLVGLEYYPLRRREVEMKKTVVIAFLLIAPLALFAQKWSTVTGRIVDHDNQAVSRATVILARPGDNFTRQTLSSDDGEYYFEGIPAGKYTVEVHKQGYQIQESKFTVETGVNPRPVKVQLEEEVEEP